MDSGLSGFDAPGFSSQALAPSQANDQAVQVMKKKKSGFGSWLPTIGSIALPAAAALLAPETGGTSLLALAALSGAGSAFGKVGENAVEHNKNLTSGTGGEFLSGAAGGMLGGVGGKVLGKTAGVVKDTVAPRMFSKAFTVPSKLAPRLNPEQVGQKMLNYGVGGTLENMGKTADMALDPLNKSVLAAAANIPGDIKTSDFLPSVMNILKGPESSEIDEAMQKKILSSIFRMDKPGKLPDTIHPVDAVDNIRQLEKVGYQYINSSTKLSPNLKNEQIGKVYLAGADALKDSLEKAAATSGSIDAIKTPEIVAQLNKISPKLANEFMQTKDFASLRSLMSPFVRLKQMIGLTKDASLSTGGGFRDAMGSRAAGGALGFGLGGPVGAAAGVMAAPFVEGLESSVRAPLTTGASRLINFGNNLTSKAIPKATKAGAQLITHGSDFSSPDTALPGPDTSPFGHPTNQDAYSQLISNNDSLINQTPDSSGPGISGYTDDELQTGIANAIGAGDIKAATEIQNLLKLNQSNKTGANAPLGQVQKRQLAKINTAVDRLQRVAQDYESFNIGSGPLGKLGGKVKSLEGHLGLNSNVAAYNDQLNDVAFEIASALAGGGASNVSDARVKQIAQGLPKIGDTHEQAVKKINNLLNDLLSAQKEFVSVPSTGGDNVADPNSYTGSPQGFSSNPAQVQFAQ